MGLIVVLGIASIFFLSAVLIVAALMMRGQWDRLGAPDERSNEPSNEPPE
ncbi:MAG TPA: hypothetical protein VE338_22035 [Ktedonobacterales bacterium]|jgi:predicted RND superfamily exporter protein|nr:hypothetical protein [Ktedonobacterales bacterium]